MKKRLKALLLIDAVLGVLLFLAYGYRHGSADELQATNGVVLEKKEDSKKDTEEMKIALTFDDGPHPVYTEELLDGLKERGVHATFFVTGEHAQLHPEIIKRMNEEGHLIGNHTYSHIQLKDSNREQFREELVKTNEILSEITGKEVIYVRPPYGTWDKKFESELNMFPVLWNVEAVETENMGKYLQQLQGKIFLQTLTVPY